MCIRVKKADETHLANEIASRHLATTTDVDAAAESAQRDDSTTKVGEATPSATRDDTKADGEANPKHATSGATGKTMHSIQSEGKYKLIY